MEILGLEGVAMNKKKKKGDLNQFIELGEEVFKELQTPKPLRLGGQPKYYRKRLGKMKRGYSW